MEHNEIKEAIFEAFKAVNEREELKAFIMSELFKAVNDDRWITIHPHGEDSDDYRRLKIKDGETVEEAMHRQGYYNKRKAKDEKKAKEAKTYTEENYNEFHKLYYEDTKTNWEFTKQKGGKFSYSRYNAGGAWIHSGASKAFESITKLLDQHDTIKLVLPKLKVRGKSEFAEDKKNLENFIDKGFKIKAQYDDGYNIKYVLEKEDNNSGSTKQSQTGSQNKRAQAQEIENLLKDEVAAKNDFLNEVKNYKKIERQYNNNKISDSEYLAAGKTLLDKQNKYKQCRENNKTYVEKNSNPIGKNADIAGAKKGKPMSFDEANQNKANPEYINDPENEKYNRNCQSCVLAYEARRRGYDVKAIARSDFDKTKLLSQNSAASLIDNQTGKPCEYEKIKSTNSSNLYNTLDKTIKENERYFFVYSWFANGDNGRHVVTIEKDENKNLAIYDPQTGRRKYKDEMKRYFSSYLKFNGESEIGFLRVDDKELNNFFVNDGVLEKN